MRLFQAGLGRELAGFGICYGYFLWFFLPFLAVIIFADFLLGVTIDRWTLPVAFAVYGASVLVWLRLRGVLAARRARHIGYCMIVSVAVLWGGAGLFGRTYDLSYDGQYYHEPAVIALSNGWNPLKHPAFPLDTPQYASRPLIEGSPKVAWAIEASIDRSAHNVDAASVLNPIVALITCLFVWRALRLLGLKRGWSAVMVFGAVFSIVFVQQMFSLREDNLSYDFLLIGITAVIHLLAMKPRFIDYGVLLVSGILLAGTKFSNLYIFLALYVIGLVAVWRGKLYRSAPFRAVTVAGVTFGLLLLVNPYGTNIIRHGAADYPYNQAVYAATLRDTGVPANIRQASRTRLFYYGVFSAAEVGDENSPLYYARLKIPFTFTAQELGIEASDTAKLVGGYGVWFSGIFICSLLAYCYMAVIKKSSYEATVFRWLTLAYGLTLASCLLIPIPNYARYNSQLLLLPIVAAVALLLVARQRERRRETRLAIILLAGVLLNVFFVALPATAQRQTIFTAITSQLSRLRDSGVTYRVHSDMFYTSYTELQSYGVKIEPSQSPLTCPHPITLVFPAATQLCETANP